MRPHDDDRPKPIVDAPSPDVDVSADSSALPGMHRGGFQRLPTAPVDVTMQSAPTLDAPVEWAPSAPVSRGLAGWALGSSIVGLVVSLVVGWGFPIGLVGAITAIIALRRPVESRQVAVWALVLGIVSVLYSAGWLWWAASRANLFG
ncbi:hypothetical protein GCM10009775_21290 [Microbacterium aoyamense]|uniref:DUF4190 domain-containing protein n=1 Tax=Microbacterium aoyamense TaxID=344166 RepID=A0ABP5B355_9MICO|nr:hypothetical protein [Microbacterium aoyamense]